jgi:hypothetical protein
MLPFLQFLKVIKLEIIGILDLYSCQVGLSVEVGTDSMQQIVNLNLLTITAPPPPPFTLQSNVLKLPLFSLN